MQNLFRTVRLILIFGALALVLDVTFSLIATCDQYDYAPIKNNSQYYCNPFDGPFSRTLVWFANLLKPDWVVAAFTVVLAISTIGLWLSTEKLWTSGNEQVGIALKAVRAAEKSADAARLNAQASLWVELPIVFVETVGAGRDGEPVVKQGLPPKRPVYRGIPAIHRKISIGLRNVDRSPAIINRTSVEFGVYEKLPFQPSYPNAAPYKGVIDQNSFNTIESVEFFLPSEADINDIQIGAKHLWVWGFVKFEDFMESNHEVHFLFRWEPNGEHGEYVERKAKRYSYTTYEPRERSTVRIGWDDD